MPRCPPHCLPHSQRRAHRWVPSAPALPLWAKSSHGSLLRVTHSASDKAPHSRHRQSWKEPLFSVAFPGRPGRPPSRSRARGAQKRSRGQWAQRRQVGPGAMGPAHREVVPGAMGPAHREVVQGRDDVLLEVFAGTSPRYTKRSAWAVPGKSERPCPSCPYWMGSAPGAEMLRTTF